MMRLGQGKSNHLPIVTFLGPASSYTHQAALRCLDTKLHDFIPASTISAVQSEEAALGVIPIENSTNGAVVFTFELLADRHSQYPDVYVSREFYLDVSHCLLGRGTAATDSLIIPETCTPAVSTTSAPSPSATQLNRLEHIKRLYTHPQAWGQCDIFLSAYLKNIERIDVSSTSRAAEMVKMDASGESAAIASKLAAEIYGLDVIAEGIQDRDDNMTRFFVLRKGIDKKAGKSEKTKTMISFEVNHQTPGALASVLQCFVTYSLNLTSINSRPTKVVPFQYIFFLEFQGSRHNDPEERVEKTLDSLNAFVQVWRWLGSWDDELRQLNLSSSNRDRN